MTIQAETLKGISFDVRIPELFLHDDVPPVIWSDGRQLIVDSFADSMDLDPGKVDEFVGDRYDFRRVHQNLNILNDEGRVNPQSFSRPLVAYATDWRDPDDLRLIGISFSADAVSGATEEIRRKKAMLPNKRYRWIEKIAVDPEYQRQGIGSVLAMLSLRQAFPLQPASAFTWPELSPDGSELMESIGLKEAGRTKEDVFDREIDQVWYRGRSARRIAKTIFHNIDNKDYAKKLWVKSGAFSKFFDSLDRDEFSRYPR